MSAQHSAALPEGFETAKTLVEVEEAGDAPARQLSCSVMALLDAILHYPFVVVLTVFETFYWGVQAVLKPVVKLVPRKVCGVDLFTANAITFGRVFLVIPVAIGMRFGRDGMLSEPLPFDPFFSLVEGEAFLPGSAVAAALILLHDFLDHLDGIVAVAQREAGTAAGDDPLFGGFIDAFIDKVFFAVTVWTSLTMLDYGPGASAPLLAAVLGTSAVLVAYEVAIATVRVNDYFTETLAPPRDASKRRKLRAAMEGKLKQKLTSFGIAFLALATPSTSAPLLAYSAEAAAALLALASFMAHKSLMIKLSAYPGWEAWAQAGGSLM